MSMPSLVLQDQEIAKSTEAGCVYIFYTDLSYLQAVVALR